MRLEHADAAVAKGWFAGPWNSGLTVSVGYANQGAMTSATHFQSASHPAASSVVDEPHVHERITEIYLVARGWCVLRVEQQDIPLQPGDMAVVEPGEAHTFLRGSPDYFHFVVHVPGLAGDEARAERSAVPRSRLGL